MSPLLRLCPEARAACAMKPYRRPVMAKARRRRAPVDVAIKDAAAREAPACRARNMVAGMAEISVMSRLGFSATGGSCGLF